MRPKRYKHQITKEKVKAEYHRRTRKFFTQNPIVDNLFKTINTWELSFFCYSTAFIDWTKERILETDRRNRKLLTLYKAHHPKDDVHRLYIKGKEGVRELKSIREYVEQTIVGFHGYMQNSQERHIPVAWRSAEE